MAADSKKERVKDEGNQKLMHVSRTDFVRNLGTGEDILPPWDRVLLDYDPEGDGCICEATDCRAGANGRLAEVDRMVDKARKEAVAMAMAVGAR